MISNIFRCHFFPYAVYEPGVISGNNITIVGDTFRNIGSNVLGENSVLIAADSLIEQNWVASHHTINDSARISGFFNITRNTETEHVTRSSTIASNSGDVTLMTQGTFRNTASDIFAGNNIQINANNVEISDGVHQSTNFSGSGGFSASVSQAGWNYSQTEFTETTQRSSNLVAGNNLTIGGAINLETGEEIGGNSINIIGSNLIANNDLTLTADTINIEAGEYTNTQNTTGFGVNIAASGLNPSISVSAYVGEGSQTILTPSNLIANNILIQSTTPNAGNTNIVASNLWAADSININTANLSISGDYQVYDSEMDFGSIGIAADILNGGASINVAYQHSETEGGTYVSSNLNAQNINFNGNPLNTNSGAVIEGTNINGNAINPQNDYESSTSFGGGISVNPFTGAVSVSGNFNDFSISGGMNFDTGYQGGLLNNAGFQDLVSNIPFGSNLIGTSSTGTSGFLSLGYGDYRIGTNFASGAGSLGTTIGGFLGYGNYGTIGISHSTTNGTSTHNVWSPNFSAWGGLINGGASFQEGNYVGGGVNVYGINVFNDINEPFNYTCFKGWVKVKTLDSEQRIDTLKVGDKILSYDEKTKQIEIDEIEKVFIRQAKKILKLSFSDGSFVEVTPDHPYFTTSRGWVDAGKLNIDDKLLNLRLENISLVSSEEEAGDQVFNLLVKKNHNYFAGGVLVHNGDPAAYGVIKGEVIKDVDDFANSKNDSSKLSNLNDLDRDLNNLIAFTKNDRALTDAQKNEVMTQIQKIQSELKVFQVQYSMNGSSKSLDNSTKAWLNGRFRAILSSEINGIQIREKLQIQTIQSRNEDEINQINNLKDSIQGSIKAIQSPGGSSKIVQPSWVAGILLDELINRDFVDNNQDKQLREYMNSTNPIPDSALNTSYGLAQMNLSVAIEVIEKGYLPKPNGWSNDKNVQKKIAADYLLDDSKAPILVAARIQEIYEHWTVKKNNPLPNQIRAYLVNDLKTQPEIFGSLYSIGLENVKTNPRLKEPNSNTRGKTIGIYSRIFDHEYGY